MVYNTTQHPLTPTPTATHCTFTWRREGCQREGRLPTVHKWGPSSIGATVHELGRKYQPVYKICWTHATKSVNRSIFKKSRHLGFVVFIVHSSMGRDQLHLLISPVWRERTPVLLPTTYENGTFKLYSLGRPSSLVLKCVPFNISFSQWIHLCSARIWK
jgi:hypothetical protein